jgi:hypothetical protein
VQTEVGGRKIRVGGMAKGSGMIHPDLATLLGVITTDAAVEPGLWRSIIRAGATRSFNQVRTSLFTLFNEHSDFWGTMRRDGATGQRVGLATRIPGLPKGKEGKEMT